MCTSFTLHYKCTHKTTFHRCGRFALTSPTHPYHQRTHGKPTATSPSLNNPFTPLQQQFASLAFPAQVQPCDPASNLQIHDSLDDICMKCKLDAKMTPGRSTGAVVWGDMGVRVPEMLRVRDVAVRQWGEMGIKVGGVGNEDEGGLGVEMLVGGSDGYVEMKQVEGRESAGG